MKRPARRLFLILLIVLVYLVWHPQPARREVTVTSLWAIEPASAPVEPGTVGTLSFESGTTFGYLTNDGELAYRGRTAYRVALDSTVFLNFSRSPAELIVQHPNGEFRSSIPVRGYPILSSGRLFGVSDAGGAISEWTLDGEPVWSRELAAPIVSFAATDAHLALGLVAGGAVVLDRTGARITLQSPAATVESVVHSVALYEDPPRLAVIAGAEPDVGSDRLRAALTLYDLSSDRGVPILRRTIARSADVAPAIRLVSNGSVLVFSSAREGAAPNELIAHDLELGDDAVVPLRHPARSFHELGSPPLDVALTVSTARDPSRAFARQAEVVLFSPDGLVPLRASWAADHSSLEINDSRLVFRIDDRYLALEVETQ